MLLAAARALEAEHEVVVRAPLPEADAVAPARFPAHPLDSPGRKLAVLPRLAGLLLAEGRALARLRPDLIHVHDEPSLYVYGLAARTLRPRPFVLWHVHAEPGAGRTGRLRAGLADACILISDHVSPPPGLPARRLRNPLPLPDPLPEPPPPRLDRIAVVGALSRRKGQDLAVEALAHLRRMPGGEGARLTLIGPEVDPAFAAGLRARVAERGLGGAVAFAGPRPAEAAFAGVGIALCPSRAETQPLALAEALARGLPVVVSDIPAHRTLLDDAGGGPTVPAEAAALARALLAAAGQAPPPGRAGRVRALFAPARFEDGLRALVREVVPAATAARPSGRGSGP